MKKTIITTLLICHVIAGKANPCTGVDRSLSANQRENFSPAIEQHLNNQLGLKEHISIEPQDVLQVFRLGHWHIVYVGTHVSDEPYLFYAHEPQKSSSYMTIWAGAAMSDEAPEIRRWLIKNASGIPGKLAKCFAWHVSKNRDM